MTLIKPGEVMLLSEIVTNNAEIVGKSVRTIGRLVEVDFANTFGYIEVDKSRLCIDISRLSEFVARVGTMYEFVGEMRLCSRTKSIEEVLTLDCRIWRAVDGIDMHLYRAALKVRRASTRENQAELATFLEEFALLENYLDTHIEQPE